VTKTSSADQADKLDDPISRRKLMLALASGAIGAAALVASKPLPEVKALTVSGNPDYVEFIEGTAPSTPALGRLRLWGSSTDKMPYITDDGGVTTVAVTRQDAAYIIEQIGATYYARPAPNSGLTAYSGMGDLAPIFDSAVNALISAGGGKILIRHGTYNWSTAKKYTSSVPIQIEGESWGTIITQPNFTNLERLLTLSACQYWTIRNIQWNGNKANNSGGYYGIVLDGSLDCTVEQCWIHDFPSAAINTGDLGGGALTQRVNILRNLLTNNGGSYTNGYGLFLANFNEGKILGNTVIGGPAGFNTGIMVHPTTVNCTGNIIAENSVWDNGARTEVGIEIGGGTGVPYTSTGNVMSNNRVLLTYALASGESVFGLEFFNASNNNVMNGNTVTFTNGLSGSSNGIHIDKDGGSASDLNVISGNNITGAAQGIYLVAADYTNVIGNVLSGCTYPIYIGGGSTNSNNLILGNSLHSNTYPISDAGTGTIIKDNQGYNPRGAIANPYPTNAGYLSDATAAQAFPTSNTNYTVSGSPKLITVSGGTVTSISIDGTATGLTSGAFTLQPGQVLNVVWSAQPSSKVYAC